MNAPISYPNVYPTMASVKNAAARFNVTPEYVRKLCRTGKICYTAISSRKWLINMDTQAQFFAQGEPVREDLQPVDGIRRVASY